VRGEAVRVVAVGFFVAAGFCAADVFAAGVLAALTTSGSCACVSSGGAGAGAGRFSLRRWGRDRGRDPITPGLESSLIAQSWRTEQKNRSPPKISFYR
jgi:hypothetical protein